MIRYSVVIKTDLRPIEDALSQLFGKIERRISVMFVFFAQSLKEDTSRKPNMIT